MRAVDTNVLVRLLVGDDETQALLAQEFVRDGAWVSAPVLAECVWVLESAYRLSARRIAVALRMLCDHESLVINDRDAALDALVEFEKRPSLGFTDCFAVALARHAGHTPFGTFDRALSKLSGTRRI